MKVKRNALGRRETIKQIIMKTFDAAEIYSLIESEFKKTILRSKETDDELGKPIYHLFDAFFTIKEELYIWFEYHLGHKSIHSIAVTDDDEIEIMTDFEQLKSLLSECITKTINK